MKNPFGELIGLRAQSASPNASRCTLAVRAEHLNPFGVVHGAVVFALADTGMGMALYPALAAGERCATIEIKINYFRPASSGELVCESRIVNRGRAIANLESRVHCGERLIALANGNFAILPAEGAGQRPRAGDD